MTNKLILKELLWEITTECNKNCAYCGSKDVKQITLTNADLYIIAENIIASGATKVVFTGGEPTTQYDALIKCAQKLREGGINEIGVVTNGLLHLHDLIKCEYIDTIGLSINEVSDVEAYEDMFEIEPQTPETTDILKAFGPGSNGIEETRGKITIVTNFGTHNIWDFDTIFNFVQDVNGFVQIQLTMGEYQLAPHAIKYLYSKIQNTLMPCKDIGFILADNLQHEHTCSAGFQSCSITADGYVVSCLSKRAWDTGFMSDMSTDKNILTTYGIDVLKADALSHIWQTNFTKERFCVDCPSCRDQIDYPILEESERVPNIKLRGEFHPLIQKSNEVFTPWKPNESKQPQHEPYTIVTYAVFTEPPYVVTTTPLPDPPLTFLYGTFSETSFMRTQDDK